MDTRFLQAHYSTLVVAALPTTPPDLSLWEFNDTECTHQLFIGDGRKPREEPGEHDWNCTLPVPDQRLKELLMRDDPDLDPNKTIAELRFEGYYIPESLRHTCVLTNDELGKSVAIHESTTSKCLSDLLPIPLFPQVSENQRLPSLFNSSFQEHDRNIVCWSQEQLYEK